MTKKEQQWFAYEKLGGHIKSNSTFSTNTSYFALKWKKISNFHYLFNKTFILKGYM